MRHPMIDSTGWVLLERLKKSNVDVDHRLHALE
jgi:hypothetical protein